jgi:hypothetical protein
VILKGWGWAREVELVASEGGPEVQKLLIDEIDGGWGKGMRIGREEKSRSW